MKLDQRRPVTGSFGIPPEVQEAAAKARREAEEKKNPPPPEADESPIEAAPDPSDVATEDKPQNPVEMLTKIGAKFEDADFQHLLFKGFYQTELEVVKGRFKATFRTLTGTEYDEVDELLAAETKATDMTGDGFNARRNMFVLSYGVTHLQGKSICKKPILKKDKTPDTKAMALERRKTLNALAPMLTNLLAQKHGIITIALGMITADPDQYLKNS